eukprot:3107593-Rhodomonas_salina.2
MAIESLISGLAFPSAIGDEEEAVFVEGVFPQHRVRLSVEERSFRIPPAGTACQQLGGKVEFRLFNAVFNLVVKCPFAGFGISHAMQRPSTSMSPGLQSQAH